MKKLIVKLSVVAFILIVATSFVNVQTVQANNVESEKTTQITDMNQTKNSMMKSCTSWWKCGSGSKNCSNGGKVWWNVECRSCNAPGTPYWTETRKKITRTAGPYCPL